jgi:uncharacterized RDD family membrane protein YckC
MAAEPPEGEQAAPEQPPGERPTAQTPSNGSVDSLLEATGRAVAPVARVGLRGARGMARRLGLNRALDQGVDRALDSDAAERATQRVLESETAKRVWDKVLESDEAQKLVERVAEAPEVRAAITAQGVGLIEDFRRGVRRVVRRLDSEVERLARRLLRRAARERPIYAGASSRLLALAIDVGVVYGALLLISAAIALLVAAFAQGDQNGGTVVLALGALVWALIGATYLVVFWSGAGRTPGMSFVAIRMVSENGTEVRLGQAIRRVIWIPLSALPLLLGFSGILYDQQRRGWPDRRARTVVCYADPELDKGLAP